MNTHINDLVAVLITHMDPVMCSKSLPSHNSQTVGVLFVGKLSSSAPLYIIIRGLDL